MYAAQRKAGPYAFRVGSACSIRARRYVSPSPLQEFKNPVSNKLQQMLAIEESLNQHEHNLHKVLLQHLALDQKQKLHQSEGQHEDHQHEDHEHEEHQVNEPLGTTFYMVVAAIPFSMAVHKLSRPGADGRNPVITDMWRNYTASYLDKWEMVNSLHTSMVEQAAYDKHLFYSVQGKNSIDLRFNEVFNTGSPYNLAAGQQARGMDELVAHYERKNREQEERTLVRLCT